jgi:hypothetical protein
MFYFNGDFVDKAREREREKEKENGLMRTSAVLKTRLKKSDELEVISKCLFKETSECV